MEPVRELLFYKHHFSEFYSLQNKKVKEKIDYVLFLVTHIKQIPEKFFKHIEGQNGLFEIRIEVGSNIFRIFCCFDENNIIVLFNGFQKKSQKTPVFEIEKAITLRLEYFKNGE